jgi:hypothetical protein
MMLCAWSGIVIRYEPLITTLLTSASLLRSTHDDSRIEDGLTVGTANHALLLLFIYNTGYADFIHLRLEHAISARSISTGGWETDLDYNLLLVNIQTPRLPVARLNHQVQLQSCSKVLAVSRIFNSRKLMATGGLAKDTIRIFDQEEIAISTCKISKVHLLICTWWKFVASAYDWFNLSLHFLSSARHWNSFSSSVATVNCHFIYLFARLGLDGPYWLFVKTEPHILLIITIYRIHDS